MSKIEKEIAKATGLDPKRGEDRQDYLVRLLPAVAKLDDDAWNGLSKGAQSWYNDAAEKRNKDKKAGKADADILEFPDAEQEEDDKPARRRGDDKEDSKGEPEKIKLKAGMEVKLTNKRGKVYEGKITEIDGDVVVIKTADGIEEIAMDRIETTEVFHGDAKGGKGRGGDDEPEDPIKVGAQVKVVTKRGKEIVGKIVELDKEGMAIKTEDGIEDVLHERIETIKPVKAAKDEDEDKPARRGSKDEDKGDAKEEGKTRSSNAEGVSIGQRIKELIADDLDATEAQIGKALTKEGIAFKENTLKLNYVDCHKFVAILQKKKMLK